MATTSAGVSLRFSPVEHVNPPHDPKHLRAWKLEQLLAEWSESDSERLWDVMHLDLRPDMTHAQWFEAIEALCARAEDVESFEGKLGKSQAFYAARDEYSDYLHQLVTRPSDDPMTVVEALDRTRLSVVPR